VDARAGAVQELRLAGDARDQRGLAPVDHAPDDALANFVAPALALFVGEAVRTLFTDLAGQPIEHGDHRALCAHMRAEVPEHRRQDRVEILGGR
jgi:hypothetical protein